MMRSRRDKKKMVERFIWEEIEKYVRIIKRNEKELRYIA